MLCPRRAGGQRGCPGPLTPLEPCPRGARSGGWKEGLAEPLLLPVSLCQGQPCLFLTILFCSSRNDKDGLPVWRGERALTTPPLRLALQAACRPGPSRLVGLVQRHANHLESSHKVPREKNNLFSCLQPLLAPRPRECVLNKETNDREAHFHM